MITKTDTALRHEGMQALITTLGYVDAERFIALLSHEPFDYTKWRQDNLENDIDIKELSRRAQEYSLSAFPSS